MVTMTLAKTMTVTTQEQYKDSGCNEGDGYIDIYLFLLVFFSLRIVGLLSSALQGGGQVLENVAFQEK